MGWMVGLQMGLETGLFSLTGIMIGWLGSIALAAHQVVVSISTLGFTIYYGVGAAISVRVSNSTDAATLPTPVKPRWRVSTSFFCWRLSLR